MHIVKGSSAVFQPDEHRVPRCKYTALFDPRLGYDGLRHSFMHECRGPALRELVAMLDRTQGRIDPRTQQLLHAFVAEHKEVSARQKEPSQGPKRFA